MPHRTIRWVERNFEFPFDAGIYPCLIMRLRGTPARLEELLRSQPEAALRRKPDADNAAQGHWSALEHAGHLADLEGLHGARLDDYEAGRELLSAWDGKNTATEEAHYNDWAVEDVLSHFRHRRSRLVNRLEDYPPQLFSRSALHPRLQKPMRLVDTLCFFAEHDDHHLARIWELVQG